MPRNITLERSIWINAPRQAVWHSITDPEHLADWWSPDHWDIPALTVGARIMYGFELAVSRMTITAVDPMRKFGVCAEPCAVHPDFAPITMFTLSDTRGGTHLTLTQSGYDGLPDPCRQYRMAECANGFQSVLENLKFHLEDSAIFPHMDVEMNQVKSA